MYTCHCQARPKQDPIIKSIRHYICRPICHLLVNTEIRYICIPAFTLAFALHKHRMLGSNYRFTWVSLLALLRAIIRVQFVRPCLHLLARVGFLLPALTHFCPLILACKLFALACSYSHAFVFSCPLLLACICSLLLALNLLVLGRSYSEAFIRSCPLLLACICSLLLALTHV